MKLFDILPGRFFSVLASKNRQLYIDALFLLQDCFSADELVVSRSWYADRLKDVLGQRLDEGDFTDEEDVSENIQAPDKAYFIIRKLEECGWIISEQIDNQFEMQLILPDYAIDILSTLRRIAQGDTHEKELRNSMRTSYSLLATAKDPMDKVDALDAVVDNFHSFERELLKIFTNMRRYHKESASIDDVNDLLSAFLERYQENIDRRYIAPLTGTNSVVRFRTAIRDILSSWLVEEDSWTRQQKAWIRRHPDNSPTEDDAADEMIRQVDYVLGRLDDVLPSLVEKIREKDSIYKERTISRIRYKSRSGMDIRRALTDLIKEGAFDDALAEDMASSLYFTGVRLHDRRSLYERSVRRSDDEGQGPAVVRARVGDQEAIAVVFAEAGNKVSLDEIDAFVLSTMGAGDEVTSCDFKIEDLHGLVLFILATLRAQEMDSPYVMNRDDGYVDVDGRSLPAVVFRRR